MVSRSRHPFDYGFSTDTAYQFKRKAPSSLYPGCPLPGFSKQTRKFSGAGRRHAVLVQVTQAHCNDNYRPDPRVASASQRAKRQMLV
jgi:hypothetical protein